MKSAPRTHVDARFVGVFEGTAGHYGLAFITQSGVVLEVGLPVGDFPVVVNEITAADMPSGIPDGRAAAVSIATWRGTTNCDRNGIAISFTDAAGKVTRLQLPIESACLLARSLNDYLLAYLGSTHSHIEPRALT